VNDARIWRDDEPPSTELERLVEEGPFDAGVELKLGEPPTRPVLVRPLVTDPSAAWVGPLQSIVPPEHGQRLGVTASSIELAAKLAADAAVWFADHGRRSVVIDGSIVAPVLGKPLPEDGDEGLVDAALFGVSTSLAARRTLASGVSVMTAGSYPVSVESVLGGDDFERVLASFAHDVLVFVILPVEFVPVAAHALTGLFVVGDTASETRGTADRAGLSAARSLLSVAVVASPEGEESRTLAAVEPLAEPETDRDAAAQQNEPDRERGASEPVAVVEESDLAEARESHEPEEPAAEETLAEDVRGPSDDRYGTEVRTPDEEEAVETERSDDQGEGEATSSGGERIAETEASDDAGATEVAPSNVQGTAEENAAETAEEESAAPLAVSPRLSATPSSSSGEAPADPDTESPSSVVLTASRASEQRKRRGSRVGMILPIVIVAAAVGWWLFTNGPLASNREMEAQPRSSDVRGADAGRAAGSTAAATTEPDNMAPAGDETEGDGRTDEAPDSRESQIPPDAGQQVASPREIDNREPTGLDERPPDTPSGTPTDPEGAGTPWFERGTPEATEAVPLEGPGGPYVVYISSHRRLSLAELEVDRAERRGIRAVIVEVDLGEQGTWQRLALPGGFPTLARARVVLDKVGGLGYEGAWIERRETDTREG